MHPQLSIGELVRSNNAAASSGHQATGHIDESVPMRQRSGSEESRESVTSAFSRFVLESRVGADLASKAIILTDVG